MINKTKLLKLLLPLCLLYPVGVMAQQPIKSNPWVTVDSERSKPVIIRPTIIDPVTSKSLKPEFYIQPAFQVGTLMAVGASVGGYISNFNVEAFYMLGLAKSEDIYWSKNNTPSVQCSYKPTAFGLRLGYGIMAMDALRLTPQVGIGAISIKCSDGDSKGNATAATLGLRADYAVAPHFQLFAAPEVSFAVSKSDVFQQLMDVSSKIKSWASGFNVRLGLSVSF